MSVWESSAYIVDNNNCIHRADITGQIVMRARPCLSALHEYIITNNAQMACKKNKHSMHEGTVAHSLCVCVFNSLLWR